MNALFELEDPLVEVVDVTEYSSGIVAHVRKSTLDAMGGASEVLPVLPKLWRLLGGCLKGK
jgi:hypothetical protein